MAESELELALNEAAEGSAKARRRVYELLAQASLYVESASRPDRGGMTLTTSDRPGGLEMTAFTSLAQTLARNMRDDLHWAHAPASWIFSEALRLGCVAVRVNPPQCDIPRADFPALAEGRVPEAAPVIAPKPPAAPVPAPSPEPEKPSPVAAPPAKPPAPKADAPKILSPRGPIPGEARAYLPIVLRAVDKVTAAYLFDLLIPGEKRMLCLGLRVDLPSARWEEFIAGIEQLEDIPGFPDGVATCPLNDEMLASARKVGVQVL